MYYYYVKVLWGEKHGKWCIAKRNAGESTTTTTSAFCAHITTDDDLFLIYIYYYYYVKALCGEKYGKWCIAKTNAEESATTTTSALVIYPVCAMSRLKPLAHTQPLMTTSTI